MGIVFISSGLDLTGCIKLYSKPDTLVQVRNECLWYVDNQHGNDLIGKDTLPLDIVNTNL